MESGNGANRCRYLEYKWSRYGLTGRAERDKYTGRRHNWPIAWFRRVIALQRVYWEYLCTVHYSTQQCNVALSVERSQPKLEWQSPSDGNSTEGEVHILQSFVYISFLFPCVTFREVKYNQQWEIVICASLYSACSRIMKNDVQSWEQGNRHLEHCFRSRPDYWATWAL